MVSIAEKRISKEMVDIARSSEDGLMISLKMVEDSLSHLRGVIHGPPDTPYEGGTFDIEVIIPPTYPFNPPKCKFLTRLWHPNISSVTGAICLDILKDQWAASMTLRSVLISIQALLDSPQPDDPQDAVVARQYVDNLPRFRQTAKFWTKHFATPDKKIPQDLAEFEQKIKELMDLLHIDYQTALIGLSHNNWNFNEATQALM